MRIRVIIVFCRVSEMAGAWQLCSGFIPDGALRAIKTDVPILRAGLLPAKKQPRMA